MALPSAAAPPGPPVVPGPRPEVKKHLACDPESIASILGQNHPEVTINFAEPVAEGGSFGGAGQGNIPFPANATGLPALCAVSVNVKSSATSAYNFGLFLPDQTWNERFMTGGNGGFGGGINWPDMGRYSKYGFASMSTDTGHSSNPLDGSWGLNKPESLIDWGYRAMHGSVVLAKEIITGYYSEADGIKHSYYASCSTGGRQGLREVQLYPDSFDGILVGAPAWWSTHLSSATLWQGLYNYPPSDPKSISPALFPAVVAEMTKQCDPQDGVVDGIVSDPNGCNFNFEALLCTSPGQTSCLTAAQLTTLYKFYNDWVDEDQTFVFPGINLGADPSFLMSAPVPLGYGYFQYWLYNDTNWDYTKFTYADVKVADSVDPGNATADDFDAIGRYQAQGGKIIMYHGEADNLIPTKSSSYFYKQVQQRLAPKGVSMDDFFRFFLVPGMGHCSGSANAPWYFSAGSQALSDGTTYSVPGYSDADHDAILSLLRWVEGDKAPEHIIATKFQGDNAAGAVVRQRPLCVFPKQAKFIGGDVNAAKSWECKSLY
ncbi:feruloyl esterase B precursor [Microdochium trichocladiopsis]|uniref:Carboxylic ester hydrolase n=1 Tax=Microdochium trichocladiopsis TaxID=1682393 RepID=A0A9P9BQ00_9PEZI|nr:feruloyl esterase B precursor [Microdochium trichocladiopsis]KAH7033639.1 feruloyl esterase B precursor [Microdochium trichocladiopsis]